MQGMTTDNTYPESFFLGQWKANVAVNRELRFPLERANVAVNRKLRFPLERANVAVNRKLRFPLERANVAVGRELRFPLERENYASEKSERRCQQRITLPWGKMRTVEKEHIVEHFSQEKQQRKSDGHHQRHG